MFSRHFTISLFAAACVLMAASCRNNATDTEAVVKLILDTDLGPDCDDAGAFALMYALEEQGKLEVLATIACNRDSRVVPCIKVLNSWYGHKEMCIGAPDPANSGVSTAPSMTCWQEDVHWPDSLCLHYAEGDDKVENAVKVYRKILSGQRDSSVTICSIGFYSNLAALLRSGGDEYCPLSGKELVARKVVRLVSMAGAFPGGKEFNIESDVEAARIVSEEWPGEIVFSGFEIGERVWTGRRLLEEAEKHGAAFSGNPVVDAYAGQLRYGELETGHNSWDGTAMLIAVLGPEPYFELCRGRLVICEDGSNGWQEDSKGPHEYVKFRQSPERIGAVIDSITLSHSKFAYLNE